MAPAVKVAKKLTMEQLVEMIKLLLDSTREELTAIVADPKASVLKINIATAIAQDIKKGQTTTVDKYIERIFGKPKQAFEVAGDPDRPMNVNHNLSPEQTVNAIKAALKDIDDCADV